MTTSLRGLDRGTVKNQERGKHTDRGIGIGMDTDMDVAPETTPAGPKKAETCDENMDGQTDQQLSKCAYEDYFIPPVKFNNTCDIFIHFSFKDCVWRNSKPSQDQNFKSFTHIQRALIKLSLTFPKLQLVDPTSKYFPHHLSLYLILAWCVA